MEDQNHVQSPTSSQGRRSKSGHGDVGSPRPRSVTHRKGLGHAPPKTRSKNRRWRWRTVGRRGGTARITALLNFDGVTCAEATVKRALGRRQLLLPVNYTAERRDAAKQRSAAVRRAPDRSEPDLAVRLQRVRDHDRWDSKDQTRHGQWVCIQVGGLRQLCEADRPVRAYPDQAKNARTERGSRACVRILEIRTPIPARDQQRPRRGQGSRSLPADIQLDQAPRITTIGPTRTPVLRQPGPVWQSSNTNTERGSPDVSVGHLRTGRVGGWPNRAVRNEPSTETGAGGDRSTVPHPVGDLRPI